MKTESKHIDSSIEKLILNQNIDLSTNNDQLLNAIWEHDLESHIDTNAALQNFKSKINSKKSTKKWAIAASILLVCVSIFLSIKLSNREIYEIVHHNNTKDTKSISLIDGSVIKMEPNAQIILSSKFSKNHRSIKAIGNIHCDIFKNPNNPFKIIHQNNNIEVKGTQFSIEIIGNNKKIKLYKGEISIDNMDLSAGNQMIIFGKSKELKAIDIKTNPLDPKPFLFEQTSLQSIVEGLKTAFQIEITYPQNLAQVKLNIDFTGETEFSCLTLLAKVLDKDLTIKQKTYQIK